MLSSKEMPKPQLKLNPYNIYSQSFVSVHFLFSQIISISEIFLIYFRITASTKWHFQDYTVLFTTHLMNITSFLFCHSLYSEPNVTIISLEVIVCE